MNLQAMMKQAQEMQAKMAKMQEQMGNVVVDGQAAGGLVTVTMNGHHSVLGIKIDPSLASADEVDILEDLIVAACTDARSKMEKVIADEMSKVTSGMKLPPNFKLPF